MAFDGFSKNSGPSIPPKTQTPFGNFPRSPSPVTPFDGVTQQRPGRPTVWSNHPKSFINGSNGQNHQRPSLVAPYVASHNAGTRILSGIPKTIISPPLPSADEDFLGSSTKNVIRSEGPVALQRMQSPLLAFQSNHSVEDLRSPFEDAQRPALSPPRWGNQSRSPANDVNSLISQGPSSVAPYVGSHDGGARLPTKLANIQGPKRTRSPPLSSSNEVFWEKSNPTQDDSERPSTSPPRLGNRSNVLNNPNSRTHQRPSPFTHNIDAESAGPNQVPKRTRSPPVPSSDRVFLGNSYSNQDDTEREMQAKAKRLARFNVELSQTLQSAYDPTTHKFSGNRHDQSLVERQLSVGEQPMEGVVGDFANGNILSDYEGLESSHVIIGVCPDMCPESERAERERKGDLDKHERLDGDRNQTSKSLAVKKYNRTAEREADFIRPMPVLQKTVDYLLALLDQPYDDSFLSMYNFLWDRMRAIRMDLRMQHIFNEGAITMLEQMIRLHIIAMHELCEYTRGEGFTEGFDAHLNIEQMNKTSVELFQMYDDHRKKGINVPTEKEFRGYYALLKLDKHPGYKVEPAELSLDLAKMTPEIRQTPEVLFARDVARACRTGNFIAFFRLARKATYLQACLMHAHFAKLRTQALASLHSGLQNNQGLPVTHLTKWLGMEEEDIESLLEYHGFLIKEFEESYMVKEGPFLNSDKDYLTRCSQLVHQKKSRRIMKDVSSSSQVVYWPAKEAKRFTSDTIVGHAPRAVKFVETKSWVAAVDEEMLDFETDSIRQDGSQVQPMLKPSLSIGKQGGDVHQVADMHFMSRDVPAHHSPESRPAKVGRVGKPALHALLTDSLESPHSDVKVLSPQTVSPRAWQVERSGVSHFDSDVENTVPQREDIKDLEKEEPMVPQEVENEEVMIIYQDEEAARSKLKLIIRIWRRRSSKRRKLREQRQLAASAALNSLSLGLPIRHNKEQASTAGELNIDRVVRERHEKSGRSWSRLNVSEVVAGILSARNPDAKCLCWKLLVCSQMNMQVNSSLQRSQATHLAGPWLLYKLMAVGKEDDELVVSSPGMSIWKKWVTSQFVNPPTCCLSVIRDAEVDKLDDAAVGASAILFLVSESIPWELQRILLHNLLMSLPSGSYLPLLILCASYKEEVPDTSSMIINGLGLCDMDKTKINSFSVVFLVGNRQMEYLDGFFSDDRLREGLQWLASQSPLHPVLHRVKTRELVLDHLNSSLELLDKMNVFEVGPKHCISAFNEALDLSVEEVAAAANRSPACWPCPEIDLLEESSDERQTVKWFLPSIGWSSAAKIEPTLNTIKSCMLPSFPDDVSWLDQGSDSGEEIQQQKAELEKCLIRYLAEYNKMMGWAQAAKEACVMLQNGARLELHGSNYYIVPKWVTIFRRIFNWRLMNLTSGTFSVAYVLEHHSVSCVEPCDVVTPFKLGVREFNMKGTPLTLKGLDYFRLEGDQSPPYSLNQPSLDGMVEVGCSPLFFRRGQSEPEAVQALSGMVKEGSEALEATNSGDLMEDDERVSQDGEFAETADANLLGELNNASSGLVVAVMGMKEDDRLGKLLEQCNMLQNMIDEKLSIYF